MILPPPPSPAVSSGNCGTTTTVNQVGVPQNTVPRMTYEEYLRRISLSQYVSEKEAQSHNLEIHLIELVKKNPKIWDWERLKISKFGRDQWIDLAIQLYEKTGKLYHTSYLIMICRRQQILERMIPNDANASSSQANFQGNYQSETNFPIMRTTANGSFGAVLVRQHVQPLGQQPVSTVPFRNKRESEQARIEKNCKLDIKIVQLEVAKVFNKLKKDEQKLAHLKKNVMIILMDALLEE